MLWKIHPATCLGNTLPQCPLSCRHQHASHGAIPMTITVMFGGCSPLLLCKKPLRFLPKTPCTVPPPRVTDKATQSVTKDLSFWTKKATKCFPPKMYV